MLVMLIIFLITVPVIRQTIDVRLPKVDFEPTITSRRSQSDVRAVNGQCEVYWNLTRVNSQQCSTVPSGLSRALIARGGGVQNITEENMPEAHIRGDVDTPYRCIGGAIFTMQRAGFARVGFISEPPPRAGARM